MSRICEISGKKPSTGHNVSHSVRRTKRRFLPNLMKKRIWDPIKGKYVTKRIAASTLRTLLKPKRVKGKAKKAA